MERLETMEKSVEGFGSDGMRFGWDLMAKGCSGIWFMTHTQKSIKRVSCYGTSKSRVGIWYIYIYICRFTLGSCLNIQ